MLQGLGLAGGNKNKALKMTGIKKSNLCVVCACYYAVLF